MSNLNQLVEHLAPFFEHKPYSLERQAKLELIIPHLQHLNTYHQEHCPEFAKMAHLQLSLQNTKALALDSSDSMENLLTSLPMTHVQLFKYLSLKSVTNDEVYKTMTSSGTSGQAVSKIILDKHTSLYQSKALSHILTDFLGTKRRRMLIIDSKSVLRDPKMFSARGAGIMGMMPFGRHHVYALDENYEANIPLITEFLEQYQDEPLLLFGFTFMVWLNLFKVLESKQLKFKLKDVVLIHAGGWKKLQEIAVSNEIFKDSLRSVLGDNLKVHNFYGMVEQTGSVYMECEAGHLHASNFSDIIIRDPLSHKILPFGQKGIIQSISVLPLSYPGFSLLTEDMGTILGEDNCSCGRKGKYFKVEGRIPKAELRGCSDVYHK